MLNRIRITGYKSLREVEVRLQPLSVLFGPNATGKSNFLDALQLLSKIVTSRTLREAFDPPYRGKPLESFSFPVGGLKGLLEQDRLSFTIEADFTLSDAVVKAVNKQIREQRRTAEPYVRRIRCEAAQAASRTRRALAEKFRALLVRRGRKRAIFALAHKILKIVFVLIHRGDDYRDATVNYEAISVGRNAPRWIRMLRKYHYISA